MKLFSVLTVLSKTKSSTRPVENFTTVCDTFGLWVEKWWVCEHNYPSKLLQFLFNNLRKKYTKKQILERCNNFSNVSKPLSFKVIPRHPVKKKKLEFNRDKAR